MNPRQEPNQLHVGLKFTSRHFSDDAEIVAIREDKNECDVQLTSSQGHGRRVNNWNLQHVKWGLERGEYIKKDPKEINISII
jgi:hypothetical protein